MFRAHVLIIRRSKLHYTASGIIKLKQVIGSKLPKYVFIELNFSNFLPITCFSVMIPEAV